MELASRIASILLGLAVAVFILWPVTIPVGFGQAWWGNKQVATTPEPEAAKQPAAPPPPAVAPAPEPVAAPTPPPPPAADAAPAEPATQAPPPSPDQGKRTLLASEQVEAERVAALNSKNAKDAKDATGTTPASPPTKLYYRVTVRDAGTLQAGGTVIRLIGVAARDADATCKDKKGKTWRCGAAAKSALAHLIHARAVTCELPKSGKPKDFTARCAVAGTDLSTWLVRQGWAKAAEPALAEAAEAAKKDGVGLWRAQDANEPPQAKSQ